MSGAFGVATVFIGKGFPHPEYLTGVERLTLVHVTSPGDLAAQPAGPTPVLMLDASLAAVAGEHQWRAALAPTRGVLITEESVGDGDFIVPDGWPRRFTAKALEGALRESAARQGRQLLERELDGERDKSLQLTNIGIALSAQTNINKLLTMILTEGRKLACCDAGSLFLIDREEEGKEEMIFKLTQNDSISFPFQERRMPLNKASLSGFVAVTGEALNIPDVYRLPADAPYSFNSSIDEAMGYRTCSMLTLPMKNYQGEVTGVLQFLNRKKNAEDLLNEPDTTPEKVLPFDPGLASLLTGLASQAAVAIDNSLLISRINHLFEGFVNAAVTAIEQRDPTTSGHSFRVADFTAHLALAAPRSDHPRFRNISFKDDEIREIRYASLLHDFGKVGVREPVLVKSKKLKENGLELIWQRFEIYKEQLRRLDSEERLRYALKHGPEAYRAAEKGFDERLAAELTRFASFYDDIREANNPSILPEGRFNHLLEIRDLPAFDVGDQSIELLNNDEFLALSVRKGSLTPEERREIESHVVHTFDFLKRIPWTPNLRRVPDIAAAHHEKLDGTGYPHGASGDDIPLASRMMTIADIYDALTASDRPYKRAMPRDRALDILHSEADRGLLDGDLVQIFTEARIYEKSDYSDEGLWTYFGFDDGFFKRNVCDPEFHDHGHDHKH